MRGMIVFCAAVLCAGCVTEYKYTPPAGKSGQLCIERCVQTQMDCRQAEQDRSARANRKCEHDAEVEYNACLKYAEDKKKCVQQICYDTPSVGQCDIDYRACYQNCGGQVEILK